MRTEHLAVGTALLGGQTAGPSQGAAWGSDRDGPRWVALLSRPSLSLWLLQRVRQARAQPGRSRGRVRGRPSGHSPASFVNSQIQGLPPRLCLASWASVSCSFGLFPLLVPLTPSASRSLPRYSLCLSLQPSPPTLLCPDPPPASRWAATYLLLLV